MDLKLDRLKGLFSGLKDKGGEYAGIAVSDGGQMTPMKSVSAVIGLSREGKSRRGSCASGKCADCPNTGCLFRRV